MQKKKNQGRREQINNANQEQLDKGTVIEALPNTMFRVEYEDGEVAIAYLKGKMRIHRIKVLVGDSVGVKRDPYGGKGRIERRY